MSGTSTKEIFLEYFRAEELFRYIQSILPLHYVWIGKEMLTDVNKGEPLIGSIRSQAKALSLDQKLFEKFLQITIDGLIAGEQPKAASNFVLSHCKRLRRKIHSIPNNLDKAYDALRALIEVEAFKSDQVYDAMVLLSEEVSSELIAREVQGWKEEARKHKERNDYPLLGSDIFWVSADFMESIDGISRYRFREHFGFSEFESTFAELESTLAAALAQGCGGMAAPKTPLYGSPFLTALAYDLWLVSRSRNLPNRIRDSVNIALRDIAILQSPEGWWTDCQIMESTSRDSATEVPTARYLPSTYVIALCSLTLLKLSIPKPLRQKGILGAKWLLERQNPDGSWSRERISESGITRVSDLFLSLLSLEALYRSGIGNIKHSIELGLDWVMKQQDEFGMWNDDGFPFPFMTVLVLELIKSKGSFANELNQYQSISKDFLNRSVQFSLEENPNSHRLAIVTAFQGIESFLYSVLSHPSVNIRIFKNADETIGMRKALTQFQTYLQEEGKIKRDEVIPYRNSLDRLAYLRDQVVHKGMDITQAECQPLINDAIKFAATYSLKVFGFDLFV